MYYDARASGAHAVLYHAMLARLSSAYAVLYPRVSNTSHTHIKI